MKANRWITVAALLLLAATAPAHEGPGRATTVLLAGKTIEAGHVDVWNNGKKLMDIDGVEVDVGSKVMVQLFMGDSGWKIQGAQVFVGFGDIPTKKGNPIPGQFPQKMEFDTPVPAHTFIFDLLSLVIDEDTGDTFKWGRKYPRIFKVAVHADLVQLDSRGRVIAQEGAWAFAGPNAIEFDGSQWGWYFEYEAGHPAKGHFVDSPVKGLTYRTSIDVGVTGDPGPFQYWPGDMVEFWVGNVYLGATESADKVSPLDIFMADTDDARVVNMARLLQSLNARGKISGTILITPTVRNCLNLAAADALPLDFADTAAVEALIVETHGYCADVFDPEIEEVLALAMPTLDEAKGNLEAGINASGIFRKNISKTEDWGEDKHKEEVMPVYLPALRSNGDPSMCCMDDPATADDECDTDLAMCDDPATTEVELCGEPGVPYEEWRLDGDPYGEDCDPRVDSDGNGTADGDEGTCVITLIECRPLAKPMLVTYLEKIDIYDDQVTTAFWPGRFSWDVYTAVSRDDGTTWKRMNVSRHADESSFELETGEPFPGTAGSPYLKVDDNYILVVWESKFCKSGNPRYSIDLCDDPATEEVEWDDPATEENECAVYCRGNPEQGTEVCEPDYPGDDAYYVTDIWGVRGQQQSVNYDEVDDVADLGIGEIPYSCLWATRGVIVTQKELDDGTFDSLNIEDDPETTDVDETNVVELGDIIWFKPERITSGRRDAYIPVVNSARGAGFAIAWQEDPDGLRPGKGKGPGEGWSGAISNHKSDIWYTFIRNTDFAQVDANFVPGGPGGGTDAEPTGDEGYLDKPGLGRPKVLVPFSLPVRISDNDMVNTDTLKVVASTTCVTPPSDDPEQEQVCFPEVADGSFVPLDPEEIAAEFCGYTGTLPHDPANCCDPNDHEGDPDCEDLKGLFGNLTGTKRYAYLARTIDELDNATGLYVPGGYGDGTPDYQYYMDRGGVLDLADTSGVNSYMDMLPGTSSHERWYGFTNNSGQSKLVAVTADGRLLDGDVFAARPMLQLQPYTKPDGTKSAWALLAYEESKGLGHSLAASEHDSETGDEIVGVSEDEHGQEKPIKQDLGKNLLYHSFDFSQPDLIHPGHVVNLPAICGGLYPTWCDDPKTPDVIETNVDNPTCTCVPSQPVPLYFDYWSDIDPDGDGPLTGQWLPDPTKFLQYRTEIARRARFLVQSPSKMGPSRSVGSIIYKQGQEGQGRPADVFIRRFVVPTMVDGVKFNAKIHNPYMFENFECNAYLDETFALPACPNGAGDMPSAVGYSCNVWGEATGDRLCGGVFEDTFNGYLRRDHVNLTSHNIDLAVDAGPVDDTPDDPTDDRYGTNKVLLWSQEPSNLGDESFGWLSGLTCDPLLGEVCPGMYSNARSHRGFVRGDFLATAYSWSPNWAAGRNGNDRYNFYVRKSFDGGQTWTTTPDASPWTDSGLVAEGIHYCREWRSDPTNPDPDGSGNLPPVFDGFDPECVAWCPPCEEDPDTLEEDCTCVVTGDAIGPGTFEPARNVSEIGNNKISSGDPRIGATPPTYPLDGTTVVDGSLVNLCPNGECVYIEDTYVDNVFFVAWGTVDNPKSTGSSGEKPEGSPLDLYYTRTVDYGDHYLKIPWVIGGENSNQGYGETVWRYDFIAKGEPEQQGECQLRATSDGSKMYAFYHSAIPEEEDSDAEYSRWYPWRPEVTHEDDLWFRRVIFFEDFLTTPVPTE
jgi:hypothetical protein